jgi:predicted nucleic acid-binding protein
MPDKYFVDTNILVYAHDEAAGVRHERAAVLLETLWNSGGGVLSTQVLQELCVSLQRKLARPLQAAQIRRLVQPYLSWEVVVNTPQAAVDALAISARHKLSYWDALLLHAAETAGAAVLYSEDLSHLQRYGTVRVVNPFRDQWLR